MFKYFCLSNGAKIKGKKNSLIVLFKIVNFVSFCRDKKGFFCRFPLFLSPPPSPPPSSPLSVYQGKVKEKKGSPTTICTSSRAAPRTTEAEESTASTCDEPLCAPELRPSCVGLLPSWSHCEPTSPLPTATTTTDTDHQTSPSVGRKRSYTASHMSGARTHVAQGFMAVTLKLDSFPLLPAFRETCICFFFLMLRNETALHWWRAEFQPCLLQKSHRCNTGMVQSQPTS